MTDRKTPPPLPRPQSRGIIINGQQSLNAAFLSGARFDRRRPRIASLPDIIDARLCAPDWSRVWNRDFTTFSTEFVGLSRQGNLVVAVAHDLGPLIDRAEELKPGDPEIDADCRLDQQDFLNLIDGLYGDIAIIDLKEYRRRYRLPFQEPLSLEQAVEDPLALARLGPKAASYLMRQLEISQKWIRESGHYAFSNRCVLKLTDAADFNYCWTEDAPTPVGHFLDISTLYSERHCHWDGADRHDSCLTEIGCRANGSEARVIGMRGGGELTRVHPGEELLLPGLSRHWRRLARPNDQPPAPFLHLYSLTCHDGLWFTQHPRPGATWEGGEPEFPVEKIGEPTRMLLQMCIRDGEPEPVISHGLVAKLAPPWFNAYHVPEEPWKVWKGDVPTHLAAWIDLYRVSVWTGCRIPPLTELRADFDLLLTLTD